MEENYKKNGGIDTRRAGGRPKLAKYERRNHHHKVSSTTRKRTSFSIRRNRLASPMTFICTRLGWMPLSRHT